MPPTQEGGGRATIDIRELKAWASAIIEEAKDCRTGYAVTKRGDRGQHKLRGADAVYVATASLFAAELVTLDREQLTRGAKIVRMLTPAGFVATT
jgi:predicted nucleic acid-binding protein